LDYVFVSLMLLDIWMFSSRGRVLPFYL